ncbi:LysR family transcriptional regulator [Pseudomonas sp. PDNC002]|uniref:LysR substrate-binding domain-containing protein n=1 Tax=Pseudomonas sp. PDNC002 TaxID=2811422 RepID=UPI001962D911|nr:LysR substrate-binding domain-containing protein [Pseudomonas sp. PDNC002]QRY80839.1 LysR family transcriptional regulator [Pseudomonas sp. PDNC002]
MSIQRLPPLNAVRAFEAAARLGSYVAASKDLHVTQPAIGRHVKLLEDWLGVQLFERTPRGVSLTPAGQRYYAKISTALQQIADAGHELAPGGTARWLKIMVVPAFAKRWLMPRLETLRQQRPGLKVAVEPNPTFTEVDGKSADLGIVYGLPGVYPQCHSTLVRPAVFPVCSPSYLKENGPLSSVHDLARHKLIHVDDGEWWNLWLSTIGLDLRVNSDVLYVSNDHALSMAEAGHGIALANLVLVKHQLAAGTLVRPLPEEVPLESYQLLLPTGAVSADVAWFGDWIRAALQEEFSPHANHETESTE